MDGPFGGLEGLGLARDRLDPEPGRLLLAAPSLVDPNFEQAVILLLDTDDGAVGVVLDRPSEVKVGSILESWHQLVLEPRVLFIGGPVGTEAALGVGLIEDFESRPEGWRPLTGRLGLVDLDSPETLSGSLRAARIFAGYAGWGPGQLQREIAEGAWFVVQGEEEDPFVDPARLRRQVLSRQRGSRSVLRTLPADPQTN